MRLDQLDAGKLTGERIRQLVDDAIGPERDLFEVVPGGVDRKIENRDWVQVRDHMRFFSAPSVINAGRARVEGDGRGRGVSGTGGGRDAAQ